jgi:hypothetical protein
MAQVCLSAACLLLFSGSMVCTGTAVGCAEEAGHSSQVHSVVSKMMMEEAFAGSWDQPTRSVVMHNAQPSRLQTLASELSDRAAGSLCTHKHHAR